MQQKNTEKKDLIISSMARKLADVSNANDLKKKRKNKSNKPYLIYSSIAVIVTVLTIAFFIVNMSTQKQTATITIDSIVQKYPLQNLNNAYKNKSITVDQYAIYLRDYLINYDSLPEKFKQDGSVVLSDHIYKALIDVWMKLSSRTRASLIKDLPDLNPHIERLKDSLGIR